MGFFLAGGKALLNLWDIHHLSALHVYLGVGLQCVIFYTRHLLHCSMMISTLYRSWVVMLLLQTFQILEIDIRLPVHYLCT